MYSLMCRNRALKSVIIIKTIKMLFSLNNRQDILLIKTGKKTKNKTRTLHIIRARA